MLLLELHFGGESITNKKTLYTKKTFFKNLHISKLYTTFALAIEKQQTF